ncbi:MAG: lysine--tRNA ligase [Candidatus Helarchaeota archaeon]
MDQDAVTFWADDIADAIINRKSFNYIDKTVPQLKTITIKSSTSISGVPHIGNASDIFRAEAVVKALRQKGEKVRFIWVAENMDPLRKVPAGIPATFEEYLGRPVAELPCPENCCPSYSEHFVNLFIDSLREYFGVKLEVLYMHQIYSSGKLFPFIHKVLDKISRLRDIINQYRASPLPPDWIPWKPICENCGKIITTRMKGRDGNDVFYSCEDYKFKHRKIEGCHYEGLSDIRKGYGKLLWRVEWASQWALWQIPFEPFGKEHGVNCPHITGTPRIGAGSFWVAGNIAEEIFDWPEPNPTKAPNPLQPYEYVLVGNQKMSASMGNTIATWDWPSFAPPETLKLFFLRKPKSQNNLMSSQKINNHYKLIDTELDIPKLVDDLIDYSKLYYNVTFDKITAKLKIDPDKVSMYQRLYELCQVNEKLPSDFPLILPPSTLFSLLPLKKIIGLQNLYQKAFEILTKIYPERPIKDSDKQRIKLDFDRTAKYLELYAPDKIKYELTNSISPLLKKQLTVLQKEALYQFLERFQSRSWEEKELEQEIYTIGKSTLQSGKKMFRLLYQILLGKTSGPRLAPLLLLIEKKWVIQQLQQLLN